MEHGVVRASAFLFRGERFSALMRKHRSNLAKRLVWKAFRLIVEHNYDDRVSVPGVYLDFNRVGFDSIDRSGTDSRKHRRWL